MPDWDAIALAISTATGEHFSPTGQQTISGGCINTAFCLQGKNQRYFVKLNETALAPMFAAEAAALQAMQKTETVRVPTPVCWGSAGPDAYLVMEYIALQSGNRQSLIQLGQGLANLHRQVHSEFGWDRDNTIGATPQINTWHVDWLDFWRKQRLQFQLALAEQHGFSGALQRKGERLCADFAVFFEGYRPLPALLHGDLWGGNQGRDGQGQAVIFDPASYYGDREADLAMTELFGGFGADFYAAYQAHYPLDSGYRVRKTLYNLYHILNHLNLFGAGYLSQAEGMIEQLLAEL